MVRVNANALIRNGEKVQKKVNKLKVPLGQGARAVAGGLVPLGNSGFYATPDEPADPRDCDRYPDSIWCGRNPFSKKPVDVGWDIVVNECGIRGNIKPVLGFIKLPPISLAYVRPECRGELAEPVPSEPVKPSEGLGRPRPPTGFDRKGANKNLIAYCGVGSWNYFENLLENPEGEYIKVVSEFYSGDQIVESNASYTDAQEVRRRSPVQCIGTLQSADHGSSSRMVYFNSADTDTIYIRMGFDGRVAFSGFVGTSNKTGDTTIPGPYEIILGSSSYASGVTNSSKIWYGKISAIEAYHKTQSASTERGFLSFHCFDIYDPNGAPSPNRRRWGSPYVTKRKCDCMGCCEPRTDPGLDKVIRLLEKIIKLIGEYPTNMEDWDSDPNKQGIQKKQRSITSTREAIRFSTELSNRLSRVVGIDLLPFTLPKTTVEKDNGGILGDIWDFITPDETETITSVIDFFKWMVLNDSANWGQWQRVIEEEGVAPPPDAEGNQQPAPKQKIVLADMATTLEELVRLNIRTQKTLGIITDVVIKLQLEAAGIKTTAAQSLLRIEDVQEFLDYPTQEKSSKVPIQITVPSPNASQAEQNDLHKFEKPSQAFVRYDDWTGEDSLRMQMIQVLQIVRYINANLNGG